MLTRHELAELRDVVTRIHHGSVAREDWSTLAALTLVCQGDAIVTAIAAQGLETFRRIVAPVYEGHAFRDADYQRMFARICAAAARVARTRVH
jgi:hypothetical protein